MRLIGRETALNCLASRDKFVDATGRRASAFARKYIVLTVRNFKQDVLHSRCLVSDVYF
jgi:hypothetical protein